MTKYKWASDGEALRAALERRQAKNPEVTQEWLAAKLNVSQALVGAWLVGRKPIGAKHFVTLTDLLDEAPERLAPKAFDHIRAYVQAAPVAFTVQEPDPSSFALSASEDKLLGRIRKLSRESGRDMAAMLLVFLDSMATPAVPDGDAKLQDFSKPEKRAGRKPKAKA